MSLDKSADQSFNPNHNLNLNLGYKTKQKEVLSKLVCLQRLFCRFMTHEIVNFLPLDQKKRWGSSFFFFCVHAHSVKQVVKYSMNVLLARPHMVTNPSIQLEIKLISQKLNPRIHNFSNAWEMKYVKRQSSFAVVKENCSQFYNMLEMSLRVHLKCPEYISNWILSWARWEGIMMIAELASKVKKKTMYRIWTFSYIRFSDQCICPSNDGRSGQLKVKWCDAIFKFCNIFAICWGAVARWPPNMVLEENQNHVKFLQVSQVSWDSRACGKFWTQLLHSHCLKTFQLWPRTNPPPPLTTL